MNCLISETKLIVWIFLETINCSLTLRLYSILTILVIMSFWFLPDKAHSQQKNSTQVDSLRLVLPKTKGDERFTIINELFKLTNATDFSKALEYAELYHREALEIGDSAKIVQGGRMMAYSLMDLGQNEKAISIFEQILGIAKRNKSQFPGLKTQIKFILNNAGIAYMHLGNYDKALEYHFQSLTLREEEGDKKSIRTALNNIGLVFYNLKDYERAIQNYQKALDLSKEVNDFNGLERIYINMGLSYNQLGKFDEAITFFNEGFSLCKGNCDDNIVKEGLEGLGFAYYEGNFLDKARENFLKSLEISNRQNDKRYQAENLLALGKIEIDQNNDEKGIVYLKDAERLAEEARLAESKISVYKELARFYLRKKDYQKSLYYENRYAQFKDTVFSENLIKNLAKVQTNYAERENLKTIAAKDQILVLKEEVITRQRKQYIFILVITCLVISLAGVLFYFGKRQQRVNRELSQAKNKIEEQNLQLSDYNKELEFKVAERTKDLHLTNESLERVNKDLDNFIYKTSHDIRGPLATLKGMCNLAMVDVHDSLALDYLKKMDFTADRLNTILTRLTIVNYINSSVLNPTTIIFHKLIEEILATERKKGIPDRFSITYTIEPGSILISDYELVKLILENLIDNAIKFFNNSDRVNPFVNISVSKENVFIRIMVEDNGIGILNKSEDEIFQLFVRASERSDTGGVGLYLAKLATEKLGGIITLEHSSEKGSVFKVLLPADINLITVPSDAFSQRYADTRMNKKNSHSISNS